MSGEREQFEAWMQANYKGLSFQMCFDRNCIDMGQHFHDPAVEMAFRAWQARAAETKSPTEQSDDEQLLGLCLAAIANPQAFDAEVVAMTIRERLKRPRGSTEQYRAGWEAAIEKAAVTCDNQITTILAALTVIVLSYEESLKVASDAIRALEPPSPPANAERWIPAAEQLPDVNVIVLVANPAWTEPWPKVMKGHVDSEGLWCGHYASIDDCKTGGFQRGLPTSDPTHWMPLPQPPVVEPHEDKS